MSLSLYLSLSLRRCCKFHFLWDSCAGLDHASSTWQASDINDSLFTHAIIKFKTLSVCFFLFCALARNENCAEEIVRSPEGARRRRGAKFVVDADQRGYGTSFLWKKILIFEFQNCFCWYKAVRNTETYSPSNHLLGRHICRGLITIFHSILESIWWIFSWQILHFDFGARSQKNRVTTSFLQNNPRRQFRC